MRRPGALEVVGPREDGDSEEEAEVGSGVPGEGLDSEGSPLSERLPLEVGLSPSVLPLETIGETRGPGVSSMRKGGRWGEDEELVAGEEGGLPEHGRRLRR